MIDRFFGRCFRGFVLPVLEYCSVVWFSAADTPLKLLDRAVSGSRILTWGPFEIAHRRSVAVLSMRYKIRCNLIHPLNGALSGPHVPVRVTRGICIFTACVSAGLYLNIYIGVFMRRLAAEPHRTAGLLFLSQSPSGTILLTPYSMVCYWRVSRAGSMLFCWPN